MKTTTASKSKSGSNGSRQNGSSGSSSKNGSSSAKSQNGKSSSKSKSGSSKDEAEGLRELFVNELKDIYWAEKALTKAIPKMIKNATSEELIDALKNILK